MGELPEQDGGTEVEGAVEPISAAAAMAIGVRKGRARDHADPEFDAFLRDQRRLISLQTEHLHEQRELILSRLRWGRFSDRLKALLQSLTVVVGLVLAGVVAVMAWQAHADHGLAIEAFSVPPALAQRGLTGQVVASEVLDRLAALKADTDAVSQRPASAYANDWGRDIKVEIPETGVSIGELNRYLREWLGSQTRITGEVVRTPAGVAVTARAGEASGRRFEGAEGEIDKLVGQAAESIYAETQPYRYATYLNTHGRQAEALAAFQRLAREGSAEDQPWAYGGWSAARLQQGDLEGAANVVREGQRRGLHLDASTLNNLSIAENGLGRVDALAAARAVRAEVERTGRGFDRLSKDAALLNIGGVIAARLGDYRTEIDNFRQRTDIMLEGRQDSVQTHNLLVRALLADHEVSAGLRLSDPSNNGVLSGLRLDFVIDADMVRGAWALGDWPDVVAHGEKLLAARASEPRRRQLFGEGAAALAVGYAHLGRLAEAEALVGTTPLDCGACLEARGWVAELAGDHATADRWFSQSERAEGDAPMGDTAWAAALLHRGDLDGAIARLKDAHRKGPHFADPLELWGEALLRKGDLSGAVAKFAEADTYAPRWGRNHLEWGEALMLSGRFHEARAQYAAAQGMDLSKPDRAALDVLLARTASGSLHG
jgi:tetratricopeptide (TPR) repeat protein